MVKGKGSWSWIRPHDAISISYRAGLSTVWGIAIQPSSVRCDSSRSC